MRLAIPLRVKGALPALGTSLGTDLGPMLLASSLSRLFLAV